MDLSPSLLASKLLAEVTPYIGKTIEDVAKQGLAVVYDKIKEKLSGAEDQSAATDDGSEPKTHGQKMEQAVTSVLESDASLRQETEAALRNAGVIKTGTLNINGPIKAEKVANVGGNVDTLNMG